LLKERPAKAPLLQKLAERKLFTLLVCNKAHTIPLHWHSFWGKFAKMHKGVLEYVFHLSLSLCVLAMSASF
jgi:hypothetical protein